MSKKHQQRQLERARAKRAAARAEQRGRSRLVAALGGGALLVALIVGVWWFVARDTADPVTEAGASTSAASADAGAASPGPSPDASSTAGATTSAFEPCPVPGDDVPAPDAGMQFPAPPAADRTGMFEATIETTCGTLVAELDADAAPQTVASFAFLADQDFYAGVPFHRVSPDFVIQGGDPTGTGRGGPGYTFADELDLAEQVVADNDGTYPRGTLAMANSGPDSNGSQFYVVQADPGYPFPPQYAVFGTVTQGMDVVDRIANGPVTGERGDEAVDPTRIIDVTVVPAESP